MKSGIINIYKEKGYTSHDVVAILRKKLNMKKIGHTGTLDPDAEGVLPICIGKATKAAQYLTDKQKEYVTTMRLGITTDTQDATGTVLQEKEVHVTKEQIVHTIHSYIGEINQIPPMYSALKVNGKKLYELARQGKTVERKARTIVIYYIDDILIKGNDITFRVGCSKGTYIRTLCHDIGKELLCGGHMVNLLRTKSGFFESSKGIRLSEIDEKIENGTINEYILPVDTIFNNFTSATVDKAFNKALYNGNKLKEEYFATSITIQNEKTYRVYDEQGQFIGIYQGIVQKDEALLKPITLFL